MHIILPRGMFDSWEYGIGLGQMGTMEKVVDSLWAATHSRGGAFGVTQKLSRPKKSAKRHMTQGCWERDA